MINKIYAIVKKFFQNGFDLESMQQERNPQDRIRKKLHRQTEQHLLKNVECAKNYEDTKFSILTTARSQFQLRVLDAAHIKIRQPSLCKQKAFVISVQLFK